LLKNQFSGKRLSGVSVPPRAICDPVGRRFHSLVLESTQLFSLIGVNFRQEDRSMMGLRKLFAWLAIFSTPMASVLGVSTSTLAQDNGACSKINYMGLGCVTFKFIGVERGKPFMAQRTVTSVGHSSDGSSKTVQWAELVSRDSAGRIRFEQNEGFKPPNGIDRIVMSDHEIERVMIHSDASEPLVTIFDCFNGKSVVLQREPQIAHVMQTCNTLPPFQQSRQPYSNLITRLLSAKTSPNVSVEDLRYKEIEGIMARGIRSTILGTEKDGKWNGQPISVSETWMSDDLATTVLYVYSDLRKQTEGRSRLTNIRRVEPESALFEIPPDYKISVSTQ
jgi:hypothetical protein